MKWEPVLDPEEEHEFKKGFISEETAKLRYETEIEKKYLEEINIQNDFIERHKHRLLSIDKFPAMAFYSNLKQMRIRKRSIDNHRKYNNC